MNGFKEHIWKYSDTYEYLERVIKMPPCIIVVAVNGGVQGKETNPAIPEIPDEIAESAFEAYKAQVLQWFTYMQEILINYGEGQ